MPQHQRVPGLKDENVLPLPSSNPWGTLAENVGGVG